MHARPHACTRNARACARTAPHTSSDSELACACCHRQVGAHASPRGPSTRAAPSPGAQARGRRHPDGGAPAPQGQALHRRRGCVSGEGMCVSVVPRARAGTAGEAHGVPGAKSRGREGMHSSQSRETQRRREPQKASRHRRLVCRRNNIKNDWCLRRPEAWRGSGAGEGR